MRIIGGEYRHRAIKMPKGVEVRPTQDRVREAVFNIIRERVPESRVLDLYAGSGAFGIEALSRGASLSIFVDNNTKCIAAIKSNLSVIGDKAKCTQLLKKDGVKAIEAFKESGVKFDIIFLDPPYYRDLAKNSLLKIDACDILAQHSFVIAEHFVRDVIPDTIGKLQLFKRKRYGDTVLSFYRKESAAK
ncbi:MAG: 16S rRNA (guanine(966)-N(2))-methyltransferase RsmD [Candidatus Omnitrophica bacterium]|nr:16S rRNA (guanine(966)-N(2))-methyltransferase RsmD [Candidatus Omnitrophota bacterium]